MWFPQINNSHLKVGPLGIPISESLAEAVNFNLQALTNFKKNVLTILGQHMHNVPPCPSIQRSLHYFIKS